MPAPPQSVSERQLHKEPPLAFLEADVLEVCVWGCTVCVCDLLLLLLPLLQSDTQIPQDVMYLLKSVR